MYLVCCNLLGHLRIYCLSSKAVQQRKNENEYSEKCLLCVSHIQQNVSTKVGNVGIFVLHNSENKPNTVISRINFN